MGYLRPDFLARCKPAVLLANDYTFHLEIGSYMDPGCTQTDKALLNDGRSSFPSGDPLRTLGPPLHPNAQAELARIGRLDMLHNVSPSSQHSERGIDVLT